MGVSITAPTPAHGDGTGDVVGPDGVVADRLAAFSGTTGKLLKEGPATTDFATSGQGDKADSAVQPEDIGTAAATDVGDYVPAGEKGSPSGVATLDSGGKVPSSQLPSTVMEYQGVWNASTNSPALADGVGNAGDVYRVSVAGSQDLGSGTLSFDVGDLVLYDGSVWQRSDSTDLTAAQLASLIHSLTAKTTPADGDELMLLDSAASYAAKRLTIAQLRASMDGGDTTTVLSFSNADYTVVSTTMRTSVRQTGTLSAPRTVTLPAASAVPAGAEVIIHAGLGVSSTNPLSIARAGSDTINGSASSISIVTPYSWRRLISDGSSAWVVDAGLLRQSDIDATIKPSRVIGGQDEGPTVTSQSDTSLLDSPINLSGLAAGDVLEVRAGLQHYNSSTASRIHTIKVKIGTTTVATLTTQSLAAIVSYRPAILTGTIRVEAASDQNSIWTYLCATTPAVGGAVSTENLSTGAALDITGAVAAGGSQEIQLQFLTVTRVRP